MNRLIELRKNAKKSQTAMAKLLSISQAAYSKYECNLAEPDNTSLRLLADFFGVSVDYLLGHSDVQRHIEKNEYAKLNRLYELRKTQKKSQIEMAKIFEITQRTFSNYENGQSQIPDKLKIKMANYFNISIDYLLGLTDDPSPTQTILEPSETQQEETQKTNRTTGLKLTPTEEMLNIFERLENDYQQRVIGYAQDLLSTQYENKKIDYKNIGDFQNTI